MGKDPIERSGGPLRFEPGEEGERDEQGGTRQSKLWPTPGSLRGAGQVLCVLQRNYPEGGSTGALGMTAMDFVGSSGSRMTCSTLIGVRRFTRHGGDDHHLVGARSEDGVQAPGDSGADCAQG